MHLLTVTSLGTAPDQRGLALYMDRLIVLAKCTSDGFGVKQSDMCELFAKFDTKYEIFAVDDPDELDALIQS